MSQFPEVLAQQHQDNQLHSPFFIFIPNLTKSQIPLQL